MERCLIFQSNYIIPETEGAFIMKQIFLICSLGLILFMTGCASVHTWQAIGYEVFQPESHHLEKLPDGRILLTQQGMVKEYYLPFFECFSVESEQ